MNSLILFVSLGAAAGAGLGYVGKCSSGACPLTANWRRGSVYGAVMGLLLHLAWGGGASSADHSTGNVRQIQETEFEAEVLQATLPVVVDFYAPWCGPCKRLSPLLDQLAAPLTNQVKFVKVNVDQAPGLARQFEVQGVPTLIFFQDGKVVERITGLPRAGSLERRLESFASKNAPLAGLNP